MKNERLSMRLMYSLAIESGLQSKAAFSCQGVYQSQTAPLILHTWLASYTCMVAFFGLRPGP